MTQRVVSSPQDIAQICAYYEQSWSGYRKHWLNPDNLAIHMGYWDKDTPDHAESLINMNRQLAKRARVAPEDRILDAGCGVGGSSFWLVKTYGASVIGITLVATQVELARQFARERGLQDQVFFEQQDFLCTNFPDDHFDVVWAQESVCHARDKRAFLAEAYRVLKPGGRMVMADAFRFQRTNPPKDEHLLQSGLSDWAIPDLPTSDEIIAWTRASGFTDVVLENIDPYTLPSRRRLYRLALVGYPVYFLRHALRRIPTSKLRIMRGAIAQWHARRLCFEGILSAKKTIR